MNLTVWIENRGAEIKYATRMIRKTPGTTAIAVMSLALGIGANTAIFSIVDAMLLKRLPVKSPQELYLVAANSARPQTSWYYPDYAAFRDHNTSFSGLAAYGGGGQPMGLQLDGTEAAKSTELAQVVSVSGNYFDVLGVEAALGRVLAPEDDQASGAGPYVVLSYDYWQSRFNGDSNVVGQTARLNGYPFTIVGVARRGFHGADVTASPNMYIPIMMHTQVTGVPFALWNTRHYWWMQSIGRLSAGASITQAETELYAVSQSQEEGERQVTADARFVNQARPIKLLPAARGYSGVRNRLERPLVILMIVVALVLLIACANVANLMLARGAARQREIAVRLAVGASRSQLTSQLLVESIVIALVGGLVGLSFAWCARVARVYATERLGPNDVERRARLAIARLHVCGFADHRRSLRDRSCVEEHQARSRSVAQGRFAGSGGSCAAVAHQYACGDAGSAVAGALDRHGSICEKPRPASRHRFRLSRRQHASGEYRSEPERIQGPAAARLL